MLLWFACFHFVHFFCLVPGCWFQSSSSKLFVSVALFQFVDFICLVPVCWFEFGGSKLLISVSLFQFVDLICFVPVCWFEWSGSKLLISVASENEPDRPRGTRGRPLELPRGAPLFRARGSRVPQPSPRWFQFVDFSVVVPSCWLQLLCSSLLSWFAWFQFVVFSWVAPICWFQLLCSSLLLSICLVPVCWFEVSGSKLLMSVTLL